MVVERGIFMKGKWITWLSYGSGDAACNIVIGMISTVLTIFYTDYVGLHPVVIGTIMLISRILDGIATFFMGFLANATKSKYGKYRPWLLWTCVPYGLSVVLLFTVPQSDEFFKIIYVFVTYNLCATVFYNTINIPYGSLAYVMTRNSHELEMLSVVRMTMASGARLIAVCATLPLVQYWGETQGAWVNVALIWSIIAILMQFACFKNCRENVVVETVKEKISMFRALAGVFANRYFWSGACFQAMQYTMFIVTGTTLTYYCKYIFNDNSFLYSCLYFAETLVMIIAMMLCPYFIRRYGKRNVALGGIIIAIVGQLIFMLNPMSVSWVVMSCIVRGIGFAPINSVFFAFIGEAIEYGQWKTHLRQESLIYAMSSVFTKIMAGVAAYAITVLLSASGYISTTGDNLQVTQPQSAIDMIVSSYEYGPLIVLLVYLITLLLYKLDKKMPMIMMELAKREMQANLKIKTDK